MKTFADFDKIVSACSYKPGWYIEAHQDSRGIYIQVGVTTEAEISWDMIKKERVAWKGGKHYLSPFMCDSEVVGAVFGAFKQAEEHETREWFRFMGRSVYNPHIDVYVLHEIAGKLKNFDTRENAMTMIEG